MALWETGTPTDLEFWAPSSARKPIESKSKNVSAWGLGPSSLPRTSLQRYFPRKILVDLECPPRDLRPVFSLRPAPWCPGLKVKPEMRDETFLPLWFCFCFCYQPLKAALFDTGTTLQWKVMGMIVFMAPFVGKNRRYAPVFSWITWGKSFFTWTLMGCLGNCSNPLKS